MPTAIFSTDLPEELTPQARGEGEIIPVFRDPDALYTNKYEWTLDEIRGDDEKLDELLTTINPPGYPSTSEADFAACVKLLYWEFTPSACGEILREYRRREKILKRPNYVERTLRAAESRVGETISDRVDPDEWEPGDIFDRIVIPKKGVTKNEQKTKSGGIDVTDYIGSGRPDVFEPNEVASSGVVENPSRRETLIEQASNWLGRSRGGIHVSDLGFMKRAYWQKKHPEIRPTERETGYYLAGKGHHGIIQYITTLPDYREVGVNYGGVRGHIDMVHDVPVELKTARAHKVRSPKELQRRQPHYFERIGFYCAMTDSHDGVLILFYLDAQVSKYERRPLIKVYDVHFDDLDVIREEINRRKKVLERALKESDHSILPDCPKWARSNCRYQELCKEG